MKQAIFISNKESIYLMIYKNVNKPDSWTNRTDVISMDIFLLIILIRIRTGLRKTFEIKGEIAS